MTPLIYADIPDPSVIRVGDNYYMTSTTMYFTPGCPVMKSTDLLHWDIIGYVYDTLDDNDHMCLRDGKHDYGRGSWASCLRWHDGIFYVWFVAYNTGKTYAFTTRDIEGGEWQKHTFDGIYHDMSVLFDDGRVFMVYGGGAIKVVELTADATAIKPDGLNKTIIENADPTGGSGLAEGAHIYKLNGYYYIFIIAWPKGGRRIQVCYRATQIDGEYECKIVYDNDIGFNNAGVAQGGIFDTAAGKWYAMLFQDRGAVGRVPVLVPVVWENDWPVFGNSKSDDFTRPVLAREWQWNHNPVNTHWTLSEREGWLRLKTSHIAKSLTDARNTITQPTIGPACSGSVKIDVSNMKNGDFAGLAALQEQYAFIGVKMAGGQKFITMCAAPQTIDSGVGGLQTYKTGIPEVEIEAVPLSQEIVYLRVDFNFAKGDIADFYYSLCGEKWVKIGTELKMSYRLSHFTGYRYALFNFATAEIGGFVDFDYFKRGDTLEN